MSDVVVEVALFAAHSLHAWVLVRPPSGPSDSYIWFNPCLVGILQEGFVDTTFLRADMVLIGHRLHDCAVTLACHPLWAGDVMEDRRPPVPMFCAPPGPLLKSTEWQRPCLRIFFAGWRIGSPQRQLGILIRIKGTGVACIFIFCGVRW